MRALEAKRQRNAPLRKGVGEDDLPQHLQRDGVGLLSRIMRRVSLVAHCGMGHACVQSISSVSGSVQSGLCVRVDSAQRAIVVLN